MPDDQPKLPFGLDVGHAVTFSGAIAAVIGTFYVSQYRISALEQETQTFQRDMREFQKLVVEEAKVFTVQGEVLRRLDELEHRMQRLEDKGK